MTTQKNLLLLLLTVVLLNLSLPPFDLGFLRYIALIPLLFFIAKAEDSLPFVYRAATVWITSFLFLLWQLTGLLGLHPLDWGGIESKLASLSITFGIWIGISFFLSLASFPLLLSFHRRFFIYFPLMWVLWEFFRSHLYSIIILGPGSAIADIFPFGFLGFSVHTSSSLLALSPFLGVFGFSLLIALINLLFYHLLFGKQPLNKKMRWSIIASIVVVLAAIEWGQWPKTYPNNSEESIGIIVLNEKNPVQFKYTDEYFKQIFPRQLSILEKAFSNHPDANIVVFSENSQFLRTLEKRLSSTPKETKKLLFSNPEHPRVIIDGDYDSINDVSRIRVRTNTDKEYLVYKEILMPLGEYQPYFFKQAADFLGQEEFYNQLAAQKHTQSVPGGIKTIETKLGKIAVISCSEILSPAVYTQIQKESPDFVVQQQRLAHFHDSTKGFYQTLALSKMRAATLRKFIVGSVDGSGFSYVISPDGELIAKSNHAKGYLYVELPRK